MSKSSSSSYNILNNYWTIFVHDKEDPDFTKIAYKSCYVIKSLEDFWRFFNKFNDFSRHQFYIMKNNIQPKFECDENKNGGSISWLVYKNDTTNEFIINFVLRLVTDNFLKGKSQNKHITGVLINPKQKRVVIKIWFRNYDWLQKNFWHVNIEGFCPPLYSRQVKKHEFAKQF